MSEDLGSMGYPLLPLLPRPLWSGVVIPVRAHSMDQIDPFENYLYYIGILDIL